MRKIRYLAMMLLSLCSITMLAQIGSGYNPDSPNEPPAPNIPRYSQLTLVADPVGGGNPTTSGKMAIGSTVNLNANKASGFRFINWTNAAGDVISENENIQITKGEADETFTAHYVYEPASPNEPTDPYLQLKVQLNAVAAEGGSVSGGGKYLPGTNVTLNASPAGNYVFKNWTDENGNVVSTTAQFSYTVKTVVETLTANFTFIPSSPNEPNAPDIALKHHVFIVGGEGGTVSASQFAVEGSNVAVSANCNSGYEFLGWFKDGILYNSNKSFTYVVGTDDVTFEARFHYNPASPSEPDLSSTKKYTFYVESVNGFQGTELKMSVFLSSLGTLGDISFQLSFPERLFPELSNITYSDALSGYTKNCTQLDETTLKFQFTGGELIAGNRALVTFTIHVPADYPTGSRNPVRMGQISFVEIGGSNTTANARNAYLGVFMKGDVNGDNIIDIGDYHCARMFLSGLLDATSGIVAEAADVNSDGIFNENDVNAIKTAVNENAAYGGVNESANRLFLDPVTSAPSVFPEYGERIQVNLENDVDIWGIQYDIRLPEGMSNNYQSDGNTAFPDGRLTTEGVTYKVEVAALPDGWQRVLVFPQTSTDKYIPDFEGKVMHWLYQTADNMPVADTEIELRNVVLALQGLSVDRPDIVNAPVHMVDFMEGNYTANMVITEERIATFVAPFSVKIPESVKAYIAEKADEANNRIFIQRIKGDSIPARTPVIVYSEEPVSRSFHGVITDNNNPVTAGILTGVFKETMAETDSYVLQNQEEEDGLAFYRIADAKPYVHRGQAYITGQPYSVSMLKVVMCQLGDPNWDGEVNIGDYTTIANYILGITPEVFIMDAADVNGDDEINVGDLTSEANLILYGNASNAKGRVKTATDPSGFDNVIYASDVTAEAGAEVEVSINMRNSVAMTGFQFDVVTPEGISIASEDDFYYIDLSTERTTTRKTNTFDSALQSNGSVRVLCGSTKSYTFDGNDGEVATMLLDVAEGMPAGDYTVQLKNIIMSDANGKTYKVDMTEFVVKVGTATGISTVGVTSTNNGKYLRDGRIVIVKNGKAFDAVGNVLRF